MSPLSALIYLYSCYLLWALPKSPIGGYPYEGAIYRLTYTALGQFGHNSLRNNRKKHNAMNDASNERF